MHSREIRVFQPTLLILITLKFINNKMKISKIAVMAVVAFAMSSMTACSSSAEKNNAEAQETHECDGHDHDHDHDVQKLADKSNAVVELTDDALYRPGKPVEKTTLIDFNATWCGPCKAFRPTFDKYAEEYAGKYDFVSLDVDVCPETANAFGITQIPHIVVISPDGSSKVLETSEFEAFFK